MSFLCNTINKVVDYDKCINECQYIFKSGCVDKIKEGYQQGRADERNRIVRELENLNIIKGEQYEEDYELQILICSTIERAIEIVRGGE